MSVWSRLCYSHNAWPRDQDHYRTSITSVKRNSMTGSEHSINRREMLRRTVAAGFGVAAPSLIPFPGGNMTLTGLPSEYDKYDALGLAELIAKKQITPAELLDAVRQRVEAINPKINARSEERRVGKE